MEEESSSDDPLSLIKPTSSFSSFSNKLNNSTEFNNLITEEFVDLNEWGALSDGDLCMSRQLAENIDEREEEEEEGIQVNKEENGEEEEEEEFSEEERKEDTFNFEGTKNNWNSFNEQNIKNGSFECTNKFENYYSNNTYNFKFDQNKERGDYINQHINPNIESTTSSPSFLQIPDHQSPLAPPPPPIVISPSEVDHITITLEKNQQCACADCGKLFNSVWYLKQHAVKHSNDRPFKCRFCMKTYKFRSNLYQHKCPERNRLLLSGEFNMIGHPYRRRAYTRSADKKKMKEQKLLENLKTNGDEKSFNNRREFNKIYSIENKGEENQVFNCRKCKLYFPSREYFGRHMAYHNELDTFKFHCERCPERFLTEQELQTHYLQHADYSPHNCKNCNGIFRSALALRRHKDNWPQCHSPPLGMHLPFFVNPIDQFSFVGSDLNVNSDNGGEIIENYTNPESSNFESSQPLHSELLTRKTTQDSGYHGSDTQSPARSHSPVDDCGSGSFASSSSHSFEQKSSAKNDLINFETQSIYFEEYNPLDKMTNGKE
ncbi:hypothetical protein Mgra_00007104 [Meloidogyne graminicola]|uniref:C2H2-type domain-containing protein n=1 Tax=Meloidogyne graminicola TaxID=189291 RepID=A0A8S9ZJC2_9BILA|nr:hypothetical protein Mgra_00007104 [Meloidogyne graminicola]